MPLVLPVSVLLLIRADGLFPSSWIAVSAADGFKTDYLAVDDPAARAIDYEHAFRGIRYGHAA